MQKAEGAVKAAPQGMALCASQRPKGLRPRGDRRSAQLVRRMLIEPRTMRRVFLEGIKHIKSQRPDRAQNV